MPGDAGTRAAGAGRAIELLYGRGSLRVTPPAGCVPTALAKPGMPVLPDPRAAVDRALAAPVARPPLAERARGSGAAEAESMARHGDPHVAFLPEGPYVVPVHVPPAGSPGRLDGS